MADEVKRIPDPYQKPPVAGSPNIDFMESFELHPDPALAHLLDLATIDAHSIPSDASKRPDRVISLDFSKITKSLSSRPTGELVAVGRGAAAGQPLNVVSHTPQGPVQCPRQIAITFSLPMVGDQATQHPSVQSVPVQVTPLPPGRWHWLDAKSLVFEPTSGRLPFATHFDLRVPANVSSVNGQHLAKDVVWNFSTPRPEVVAAMGDVTQDGRCILVASNQPVKIESVLSKTHMQVDGHNIHLRLANEQERRSIGVDREGDWLIVPDEKLPLNKPGAVDVDAGIESSEGPLVSTQSQHYQIVTANPLLHFARTSDHNEVEPVIEGKEAGQPLIFGFAGTGGGSHGPIDGARLKSTMISVTPPIANMQVNWAPGCIVVSGDTLPDTKYKFLFSKDIPGYQTTLGVDQTIIVETSGTKYARLISPKHSAYQIDTESDPFFPICSVNARKLKVDLYPIFKDGSAPDTLGDRPIVPTGATPLFSYEVECSATGKDGIQTSKLDLKSITKRGIHQCLLSVSLTDPASSNSPGLRAFTVWLQLTKLDISVVPGPGGLACFVVDKRTGRAVNGLDCATVPPHKMSATGQDGVYALNAEDQGPVVAVTAKSNSDQTVTWTGDEGYINRYRAADKYIWRMASSTVKALPGQDVEFFGWLRLGENTDKEFSTPKPGSVRCTLYDSDQRVQDSQIFQLTKFGGIQGKLHLSKSASEGWASIEAVYLPDSKEPTATGSGGSVEVDSQKQSDALHIACQPPSDSLLPGQATSSTAKLMVDGHTIRLVPLHWAWYAKPAFFAPPGWENYHFGADVAQPTGDDWPLNSWVKTLDTTSGSEGSSKVAIKIAPKNCNYSLAIKQCCSYDDPNGHEIVDVETLLVHPAQLTVGLKATNEIDVNGLNHVHVTDVVTDLNGTIVPGRRVELGLSPQVLNGGDESSQLLCSSTLYSKDRAESTNLAASTLDNLDLIASVADDHGRVSKTILHIPAVTNRSARVVKTLSQSIFVQSNKSVYSLGENPSLIIESPFDNAEGFIEFAGTIKHVILHEHLSRIQVEPPHRPFSQQEGLVKLYEINPQANTDCARVAEGRFQLTINSTRKPLTVRITPGPSSKDFDILTIDGTGAPIATELAVRCSSFAQPVDEAPLDQWLGNSLYRTASGETKCFSADGLGPPETKVDVPPITRGGYDFTDVHPGQIAPGQQWPNKNDGELISAFLHSDAQGIAHVHIPAPFSRIGHVINVTAASIDGSLGFGKLRLATQDSFSVACTPPKFLYRGDQCEAEASIQSHSETAVSLNFEIRDSTGTKRLMPQVTLKPHELISLKLKHFENLDEKATLNCNDTLLVSGAKSIEQVVSRRQPVAHAKQANAADVMNLLSTYATDLCMSEPTNLEDHASRLIALNALEPFTNAAQSSKFSNCINEDFRHLAPCIYNPLATSWLEEYDHPAPFDSPFAPSHVFSAITARPLTESRLRGLRSEMSSLMWVLSAPTNASGPSEVMMSEAKAYRAYSIAAFPTSKTIADPPRYGYIGFIQNLFAEVRDPKAIERTPLQALCWYYMAAKSTGEESHLVALLGPAIVKRASETQTCTADEAYFIHDSLLKKQAVLLEALSDYAPASPAIPTILNSIYDALNRREVSSDSDIALVSVAVTKYLRATHKQTVMAAASFPYQPRSYQEPPSNSGFAVERKYETASPSSKVWKDKNGIWRASKGSMVRCVIDFMPARDTNNAIITDWLPTGCSTGSPNLGEASYHQQFYQNFSSSFDYTKEWPQKVALYENRVQVFGSDLPVSQLRYSYVMHADTPGRYTAPGTLITCPFNMAICGSAASDVFVIE